MLRDSNMVLLGPWRLLWALTMTHLVLETNNRTIVYLLPVTNLLLMPGACVIKSLDLRATRFTCMKVGKLVLYKSMQNSLIKLK